MKKILLFIPIISFSGFLNADYMIKFSNSPMKVPEKTIPSIAESFDYNAKYGATKMEELSSVINDNSFKLSYEHGDDGYGRVSLKFDMDTNITGIRIKDAQCQHSSTGYNGSRVNGVTIRITNLSNTQNQFYQQHYQYSPGYADDDNVRFYYGENGETLNYSGDNIDPVTNEIISRKNKYPIRKNDKDRYDDDFEDLIGHSIPFVQPMSVKKDDGIKIQVNNTRSTYYSDIRECRMTFDFYFDEI